MTGYRSDVIMCGITPETNIAGRGRKLTEAHADKKIILITIIIRFCVVLFFVFAISGYIKSTEGFEAFFDTQVVIRCTAVGAVLLCFCFVPLTHRRDFIIFYENAVCYKGKTYMLDALLPISWSYSLPVPFLFWRNEMQTKQKVFNIAYIKDVQKAFNRAYMKTV